MAEKKPLMRSLGEFVGHIVRAAKTDPKRQVTKHETEERTEDSDRGRVTLRRTTIEEVEYEDRGR